MSIAKYLVTILLFFYLPFGRTTPLTKDNIREAKNIGIMYGNFDPWSEQDLARAKKVLTSGQVDMLVLLPVSNQSKNFPPLF